MREPFIAYGALVGAAVGRRLAGALRDERDERRRDGPLGALVVVIALMMAVGMALGALVS